jgi:hypothetical protein
MSFSADITIGLRTRLYEPHHLAAREMADLVLLVQNGSIWSVLM